MVRPLTDEKWKSDDEKKARNKYEIKVKEFIGEFDGEMVYNYPNKVPEEPEATFPEAEGEDVPDSSVEFDPLIRAQIVLPRGDSNEMAMVVGRNHDLRGLLIGRKHRFPALDSRVYKVKYLDGEEEDSNRFLTATYICMLPFCAFFLDMKLFLSPNAECTSVFLDTLLSLFNGLNNVRAISNNT
jgi:hypothetical protein